VVFGGLKDADRGDDRGDALGLQRSLASGFLVLRVFTAVRWVPGC
jgi:hypothetical protein